MGELRRAAVAPATGPEERLSRSVAAELYCGCCGLVVTDAR
jgi:hypothetical protein